ncbi:MAG: glycosyltransferase family 4 protein [Eubacterium sp.]|nr:glycosyltransferase family 4 protein [Eubacterium sp.]
MNDTKLCFVTTISKVMDWFVCDSTRNLSKNGYDITLICNMDEGFAERNKYAECISIDMKRGINVKEIIPTITKLYKIFKKNNYDIVQYTSPNAAFYSSIAAFLAGVPIRLYSQWGIRYISLTGVKRSVFKLVEKITCRLSTDVYEVSPMNRELAISEGLCKGDKISVIGRGGTIGVDLSACDLEAKPKWRKELRSNYSIPDDAFIYGYLGRVNADKGINELLSAFKNILLDDDNVYLVLVGMYDDSNPIYQDLYLWAKDSRHVVFTGNVPVDEVYHHLSMFDVLTHPTYREGFGKVLQEAMGMQLPIITTNIPGPSEVVEKDVSGILVSDHSIDELEKAMVFLKNDSAFCKKMSIEARKQAEMYYDRKVMLKNILDEMNNLVGR